MMDQKSLTTYCMVCGTALEGPVGVLFHLFGIRRSTRNPNLCNRCGTHLAEGRVIEVTVFFADLTSFTEMTNQLGPERAYQVIEAFFERANQALVRHDAYIDKYIGDAVMAIFNAPIQSEDHVRKALAAALDLQRSIPALGEQFGLDLKIRVGIASGFARVGRIGSQDHKDYTAIGDAVNLAARLEALAQPGEVLVDGIAYDRIAAEVPDAPAELLAVKGFKELIRAHRIGKSQSSQYFEVQAAKDVMEAPRSRRMSIGATLFAILGAPCAASALLGPLAVALGLGAAIGALAPFSKFLDQSYIRLPLQALALLGAFTNLYVTVYGLRQRKQGGPGMDRLALTRQERRRVQLVVGLAVFTVLAVAFETYAHIFIEGMPLI